MPSPAAGADRQEQLGQGGAPLRRASVARNLLRCTSSIKRLELLQLGLDGGAASVASQAALDVCSRAAERVHKLQAAGLGGGGSAGCGGTARIGRVGSRVQRQASGRAWGGEAIQQ